MKNSSKKVKIFESEKMKEKWKIRIILIMAFICLPSIILFGGCSCSGDDDSGSSGSNDTQYSVSFYTDSSETFNYEVLHVQAGSLIKEPTRPVKYGYTFIAWYKEKTLENLWGFESDRVNSDIKLFAKWQKLQNSEIQDYPELIKVYYYLEPNSNQAHEIRNINKGSKTSAPITPTKEGFEFVYWCKDTLLTEKFDFNTEIFQDIKLYAKWKQKSCPKGNHTHTVGFYLKSSLAGAEKTITVNHGDYIERPEDVNNKYSEKEIEGWYLDDDRTIKWSFNFDKVTSDLKLFAKYKEE